MRNGYWLFAALVIILFTGQFGLCQETFEIQKPEQAADFSYQVIAPGNC